MHEFCMHQPLSDNMCLVSIYILEIGLFGFVVLMSHGTIMAACM
jgi:hypothetical protein